jgi:hypothetical protein
MPAQTPQFPHYEPPTLRGIPLMDNPGQGKPMAKMIKRMLKLPKRGLRSTSSKSSSVKLPKAHRYRKERDL